MERVDAVEAESTIETNESTIYIGSKKLELVQKLDKNQKQILERSGFSTNNPELVVLQTNNFRAFFI